MQQKYQLSNSIKMIQSKVQDYRFHLCTVLLTVVLNV